MNVGPFQIQRIEEMPGTRSHVLLSSTIPDRLCDVAITGLSDAYTYPRTPYFGFLNVLLSTLVSLASRPEGFAVPVLVPEYPAGIEVSLDDEIIRFKLIAMENSFFEDSFSSVFCDAARAFRAEVSRIEMGDPAAELGLCVMISERRGW